jgi:hypothetical protein
VRSLQNPTSQVKSKLGEAGDRALLLAALRVATVEARLIANQLDSVGVALQQRAVDGEGAMSWLIDEGIADLLRLDPPSKAGGAR